MEQNVSKKHVHFHISEAVVCLECGCCFYAPVLHGEWLRGKPWDSVSARKNVSADSMSNFEIQQTLSPKRKNPKQTVNINSYCKTIKKKRKKERKDLTGIPECSAALLKYPTETKRHRYRLKTDKKNITKRGITERSSRANWGVQKKRGKENMTSFKMTVHDNTHTLLRTASHKNTHCAGSHGRLTHLFLSHTWAGWTNWNGGLNGEGKRLGGVSGGRRNRENSDDKVQTDGKLFNSLMTRRSTLSPFVESMCVSRASKSIKHT